jgi:hypothetical protein
MTGRWSVRDGTFGVAVVSVDDDLIVVSSDPVAMLRPYGVRSGWAMTPCRCRLTVPAAVELYVALGEALRAAGKEIQ